jgi:intein/homing endonuclease
MDSMMAGNDALLDELYSVDYEHKRVDPETFFTHQDYLGHFKEEIFKAWWPHILKICDPVKPVFEVILTGAMGIGKCLRDNTLCKSSADFLCELGKIEIGKKVLTEDGFRRVDGVYDAGVSDTIKIKTLDGYEIEGRGEHRVRAWNKNGELIWKFLQDISIDDVLVFSLEDKRANCEYKAVMDLAEAEILGSWTGNGHWYEDSGAISISIGFQDKQYIEHLSQLCNKINFRYNIKEYQCYRFALKQTNKTIYLRWKSFGIKTGAINKSIPGCVLSHPDLLCAFLRGLFDTDGTVYGKNIIEFTTISEELGRQAQIALLALGIRTSRTSKIPQIKGIGHNRAWTIRIKGNRSKITFLKKIGFSNKRKLEKISQQLNCGGKNDCESIYNCSNLIRMAWENLKGRVPSRKPYRNMFVNCKMGSQDITIGILEKIDSILGNGMPCLLKKIVDGDICQNKVISITKGCAPCFDLTVDGNPSYVANGFVTHNSTIANGVIAAYQLHRVLCLRDPAKFFGLGRKSKIVFGIYSYDLKSAEDTGFYILRDQILKDSPFFQNLYRRSPFGTEEMIFPKSLVVMTGSQALHAAGKNLFFISVDEMNLMRKGQATAKRAYDLANAVATRLESRFIQRSGDIPGVAVFIGSAGSEDDFIEKRIKTVKNKAGRYVVRGSIWDFNQKVAYCGKKFHVQLGNNTSDCKVLDDVIKDELGNYTTSPRCEANVNCQVFEVPVEHFDAFDIDCESATRNLAGISTKSFMKLFSNKERVLSCQNKDLKNLFESDIMQIHLGCGIELASLFLEKIGCTIRGSQYYPRRHPDCPRYLHVDLAKNTCRAGIACVHPSKHILTPYSTQNEDLNLLDICKEIEVDFVIALEGGRNKQPIDFDNIRRLIFFLRKLNFWIRQVSYDSWQSEDSIQRLTEAGIKAVVISIDRDVKPYLITRNTINAKKMNMPIIPILEQELLDLDFNLAENKVDHPEGGSKDTSDALAGATYACLIDTISPTDVKDVHVPNKLAYDEYLQIIKGRSHG